MKIVTFLFYTQAQWSEGVIHSDPQLRVQPNFEAYDDSSLFSPLRKKKIVPIEINLNSEKRGKETGVEGKSWLVAGDVHFDINLHIKLS